MLFETNCISKEEYENYYVTEEFTIQSRYGYNLKAFYIPKKRDIKFKDGKEREIDVKLGSQNPSA